MIATTIHTSFGKPARKLKIAQIGCQMVPITVVQSDLAESARVVTAVTVFSTRSNFSVAGEITALAVSSVLVLVSSLLLTGPVTTVPGSDLGRSFSVNRKP